MPNTFYNIAITIVAAAVGAIFWVTSKRAIDKSMDDLNDYNKNKPVPKNGPRKTSKELVEHHA